MLRWPLHAVSRRRCSNSCGTDADADDDADDDAHSQNAQHVIIVGGGVYSRLTTTAALLCSSIDRRNESATTMSITVALLLLVLCALRAASAQSLSMLPDDDGGAGGTIDDSPCSGGGSLAGPSCTIASADDFALAYNCSDATRFGLHTMFCSYNGKGNLTIQGPLAYDWRKNWGDQVYVELFTNASGGSLTIANANLTAAGFLVLASNCLLYTSPSPRDRG